MNGGKKSIWEVWKVLWNITENCEIEKSCIYHKITYALAVLKKVENGSEKFIDGDGNTDYSWLLTE